MSEVFDPFTLDQLRMLLLVVEEGSFSAAGRKVRRVQSAVSQAMSTLEERLGVVLWNRDTKVPVLTDEGRAVLASARRLCAEADELRRLAFGMSQGLEAQVHLCVDALFPLSSLAKLCAAFAREFPAVDLRVDTQTMSSVSARVQDGSATLGVVIPIGLIPGLTKHRLAAIRMIPVVAPHHPLAAIRGVVPRGHLEDTVQVVLTEREPGVEDQAVLGARTWRIAELHTKRALLCAGLGWGNLPEHFIRDDLRSGRLVKILPEGWTLDEHTLTLYAIHRPGARFGPAHRWLLANLETLCAKEISNASVRPSKTRRRTQR